jgi:hypothetical protein
VRAGLFDLLVTHEAAIDQPGLGRLAATLAHLLDHRHYLALITSRRGHLDAHDHQRVDVTGQLRVVRGPKPAVAHLHDRRLGIGRRGACLIGGLALAALDHFEFGQARQRLGYTGLALAGRAQPCRLTSPIGLARVGFELGLELRDGNRPSNPVVPDQR